MCRVEELSADMILCVRGSKEHSGMAGSERCDNLGRFKKEQDKVVVECCECSDYEGGVQDECEGG